MKHTILISLILATVLFSFAASTEEFGSKTELKFLSEENQQKLNSQGPTDFNSYVFSLQFPKVQCFRYGGNCLEKIKIVPKNTLTIHGLWPNIDGKEMEDCNKGSEIHVKFEDEELEKVARTYWLSLKDSDELFWNHEYNKHGLCWSMRYGKSQPEEFFRLVLDLYQKLEINTVIQRAGFVLDESELVQTFSYEELEQKLAPAINRNFAIRCLKHEQKQYLGDLEISLDLNFESSSAAVYTNCKKTQPINVIIN